MPVWEVLQGPWWFPAGSAGRQAQAAEWLDWLGGQDDGGDGRTGWDRFWSREEGITRFALTHLRRQAGALAAACRDGEVPVLGDFGTWRRPPVLSTAPPGHRTGMARDAGTLPSRPIPLLTTESLGGPTGG